MSRPIRVSRSQSHFLFCFESLYHYQQNTACLQQHPLHPFELTRSPHIVAALGRALKHLIPLPLIFQFFRLVTFLKTLALLRRDQLTVPTNYLGHLLFETMRRVLFGVRVELGSF
jgi:hypothetical protein